MSVGGLKFRSLHHTGSTRNECVWRFFYDQTYTSHFVEFNENKTNLTAHFGIWDEANVQTNPELGVDLTTKPINFENNPSAIESIKPTRIFIEGSLKKPKYAIINDNIRVKYECRDTKKRDPAPSLCYVTDKVASAPHHPIAIVASASLAIMKKLNVQIDGVINMNSLATLGVGPQFFHPFDVHNQNLPEIKQAIIACHQPLILSTSGIVYTGLKTIHFEEPISSIFSTCSYPLKQNYWQREERMKQQTVFVTRSGKAYIQKQINVMNNGLFYTGNYRNPDIHKIEVASDEVISKVSFGDYHALLLSHDKCKRSIIRAKVSSHAMSSFGINSSSSDVFTILDLEFPEGVELKDVSCGKRFSFFLSTKGALYCCGDNSKGQCATPGVQIIKKPTKVFDNVKAVQCKGNTTLVLCDNNKVYVCGFAYGVCNCSFRQLEIPEYFKISTICLCDGYFMFTTFLNEIIVLNDKGINKTLSGQTFVRAHHLSPNQTLLVRHPCLDKLTSQYGRYPQNQLRLSCDGYSSVAYFSQYDEPVNNFFSILWSERQSFTDLNIII
ncbi:hypothetical protein AKO1_010917 [Acrasis kona]|uniref:Uncharacterized protein n=1 Tax=Acrasis kona TaxID=1008807 RepID=A0AAW2YRI1_9EUKA